MGHEINPWSHIVAYKGENNKTQSTRNDKGKDPIVPEIEIAEPLQPSFKVGVSLHETMIDRNVSTSKRHANEAIEALPAPNLQRSDSEVDRRGTGREICNFSFIHGPPSTLGFDTTSSSCFKISALDSYTKPPPGFEQFKKRVIPTKRANLRKIQGKTQTPTQNMSSKRETSQQPIEEIALTAMGTKETTGPGTKYHEGSDYPIKVTTEKTKR